jgi:hypothetical protein
MKYYSAIKNEIMSLGRKWMELKITILSEISQAQKNKYHMFFSHMAFITPQILM